MFDLIISVAQNDERVRAVYMNGSRTNTNVPRDIFQDYDIVYVVTETTTFINEPEWINVYGNRIMLQEPDKLDKGIGIEVNFDETYAYLILFTDGNRLDLRLQTETAMKKEYGVDKLTIPLLDKDHILPPIPFPSDLDYHVKEPTKEQFESCTNNFWWCLQNVAKGVCRDELPYAKRMLEHTTRVSLHQMINWWIGIQTDFQVSTGKLGKYFKKYLPKAYWEMYKQTYSNSCYDNIWVSLDVTCQLFRLLSKEVANHYDFTYPVDDDKNMTLYLTGLKSSQHYEKRKVITLCGSTKFKEQFEKANAFLTLKGHIVLSLGFFEQSEEIEITQDQAQLFEKIHFEKINMCDEIFVIDVNGYIGNSTKKEIDYATLHGKGISYYSQSGI